LVPLKIQAHLRAFRLTWLPFLSHLRPFHSDLISGSCQALNYVSSVPLVSPRWFESNELTDRALEARDLLTVIGLISGSGS
jgi:hypothetical protein